MNISKLIVGSAFLLFSGSAFAAAGEICESLLNDQTQGVGPFRVDNTTQFICPTAGTKTISELYAAGWKLLDLPLYEQIGTSTNYKYKLYIYQ